jgi:general secretion pathway protein A
MDILSHFGLNEPPFMISPDPRFLYLSDPVKEALAKCEYMISNRVGPLYMYGPIGSGKTSILRRLNEKLSQDELYKVRLLISPNVKSSNSFLREIMQEFDVKTERSYMASLRNFNQFLVDTHAEGKTPLLIVDEAQNLGRDTLKLIHYLLNFETNTVKLLQVVLAGQENLATNIIRYRELASRMFPIATSAMFVEEMEAMLRFRWMVAGGKVFPFETDIIKVIFAYSKGLPRDAIKICDEALRVMALREKRTIQQAEIEQIAKGFNLVI